MDWANTIQNFQKAKEEAHRKSMMEKLKPYKVYAWRFKDPSTNKVTTNWFIDKNGERIFDQELEDFLKKHGEELKGVYKEISWEELLELDQAARRKGDGKNYLTRHQVPKGWRVGTQISAGVESVAWFAQKSGLMTIGSVAGLRYAGKGVKLSKGKIGHAKIGEISGAKPINGKISGKSSIELPRLANLRFESSAKNHLKNVEGFDKKRGFKGGHNLDDFMEGLRGLGTEPENLIISKTPHPKVKGIYEIWYQVPLKDKAGNISYPLKYRKIKFPKTIYDPKIISDQEMYEWGEKALKNGYHKVEGESVVGKLDDLDFVGFLNQNQKINRKVKNFYPTFEEVLKDIKK
ncbi:CdiA family toxin C-terminal domain-containing protein [Xylocopilactobacillus apicola]|uniref:CdiA family toxin C-terminal domain-containing protein n=1 Tax=Xylocopilactobacillus apicola TaxID=2932184 RepID=UPI00295580E0|nr:CdiA family toxin C-terminal domain-containing protein [Xylocopilactobacillus apicola]